MVNVYFWILNTYSFSFFSILVPTLINSCFDGILTILKSILPAITFSKEKFYCCRSQVMDTAILLWVSFANGKKLPKISKEYLNKIISFFF